jgi:flagellar hook protein FlgE
MIESIYIAMTGLRAFEQGLRIISNNTANLNTPGFKGSTLAFADLFYSGTNGGLARDYGFGLTTLGTRLNFAQGQLQNTGKDLDLAVDGTGFFVLRDSAGNVRYTRDGQFTFNSDGILVSTTTGEEVMSLDHGRLSRITIASLKTNVAKATSTVTFSGNVSSSATVATINKVVVIDAAGTSHTLTVKLEPVTGGPGTWTLTLLDGTTPVGTSQIAFLGGNPDPLHSKATIDYAPGGQPTMTLTLDFSTNVTSFDSGSRSTVAMASQDGHAAGDLASTTFDDKGVLTLTYSNGQKVTGPRLALARFRSPDAVTQAGENEYRSTGHAWDLGYAGDGAMGSVRSGTVENSNVDLSQEFSELVILQRGYQASSQVISTANDMLAELFAMRGAGK